MEINLSFDKDILTILLISDTHIYNSGRSLPGNLLSAFRDASPDVILHCGDICTKSFLDELRKIAPVYAVRGNRDIRDWYSLPKKLELNINGFGIYAEHGQGGLLSYLKTKTWFIVNKLLGQTPDYRRAVKIKRNFSDYDLYCFGHSHSRFLDKKGSTILINPGHMNFGNPGQEHESPSFAVIKIGKESICISVNLIEKTSIAADPYIFLR